MNAKQMREMVALPDVIASRDLNKVKATMQTAFGMEVSDTFALSLIAFVDATNARIMELETRVEEMRHGS